MEKTKQKSPAAIAAGCKQDITDSVNRALSVLPCWVVELMLANIHLQVSAAARAEESIQPKEVQDGDSTADKS